MAEKKITKKMVVTGVEKYFQNQDADMVIDANITVADVLAYCQNEKELLIKKANSKTSNKNAKENEVLKSILLEELEKVGKATTITDLMHASEVLSTYTLEDGRPLSNQKISALFKIMLDEKSIVKTVDKKKSFFSINLD